MHESERTLFLKESRHLESHEVNEIDETFAARILALLNHPDVNKDCMVDAYYYDFSVVPRKIQESLNIWRDCYLIFGITHQGEIVSKWIDRWELDCENPIIDGKVSYDERLPTDGSFAISEINQHFDPQLLSAPLPDFLIKLFGGS